MFIEANDKLKKKLLRRPIYIYGPIYITNYFPLYFKIFAFIFTEPNIFGEFSCRCFVGEFSSVENATELSKYIWLCKDKGQNFEIKWKIIRIASSHKTGSKFCQLCLTEKLIILTSDQKTSLNKRSELLSKYRHKTKFKLKNFNP